MEKIFFKTPKRRGTLSSWRFSIRVSSALFNLTCWIRNENYLRERRRFDVHLDFETLQETAKDVWSFSAFLSSWTTWLLDHCRKKWQFVSVLEIMYFYFWASLWFLSLTFCCLSSSFYLWRFLRWLFFHCFPFCATELTFLINTQHSELPVWTCKISCTDWLDVKLLKLQL